MYLKKCILTNKYPVGFDNPGYFLNKFMSFSLWSLKGAVSFHNLNSWLSGFTLFFNQFNYSSKSIKSNTKY